MRLLALIFSASYVSTLIFFEYFPVAQANRLPSEEWLDVPLDHFNLFDNRTWPMRYFVNNRHYKKGGPLFVEIGGEWTVSSSSVLDPQLIKLVKKHKGLFIGTEHRYYGESLPFSTNFSTENFKYLQIEQALEDLAYVIEHVKASTPGLKNSTVIVHGCSYAGMLASWLRLRFPHVVDIAYASSAPLGVGIDYSEYYEAVNDVYANISISCIGTIREGFRMAQKLLETENGTAIIRSALRNWNCADINDMDSSDVINGMMSILNVQNDPHHFEEVSCLVLSMDSDDSSAFERLAKLVVLRSQTACDSSPISEESEREGIAWTYQTCTEVGFFQTLNTQNPRHPFGIDSSIDEAVKDCKNRYGERVTAELLQTGVERTIRRYGGQNPKISKLLSVHGSHDPWISRGMVKQSSPESPVIILDGSHCVDVNKREDDPEELHKGRERIRNIISEWINEI